MNHARQSRCSVLTALIVGSLLAPLCLAANLPANLKHDIDAGNQEWIDGLKAGDAEKIAAIYAPDAVNCNPQGDCVKGPAAVADQYRKVIAKFGHADSGMVRGSALHVDGDLAYESGYAEAHFPGGAVLRGRYSTVWKRQADGHWKIFRNMSLPDAR